MFCWTGVQKKKASTLSLLFSIDTWLLMFFSTASCVLLALLFVHMFTWFLEVDVTISVVRFVFVISRRMSRCHILERWVRISDFRFPLLLAFRCISKQEMCWWRLFLSGQSWISCCFNLICFGETQRPLQTRTRQKLQTRTAQELLGCCSRTRW